MAGDVDEWSRSLMLTARALTGKINLMATLLLWLEGRIDTRTACVRLNHADENETWLRQMLAEALEMAARK